MTQLRDLIIYNKSLDLVEIVERIYKIPTINLREDCTILVRQINAFAKRFKLTN